MIALTKMGEKQIASVYQRVIFIYVYLSIPCVCRFPWRPAEGGHKWLSSLDVGAGDRNWILWKNSRRGAISPVPHFILGANEVKMLATKPEDPSSTPGTHMVEGKK